MKRAGVFVVTGASRGLGAAIAEVAHSAGFPVALIARSQADLRKQKATLQKINPQGAHVSIHAADLTDKQAVSRCIRQITKEHGTIRALVNSAATWMGETSAMKVTAEEIRRSFELNFFSAFNATTEVLRTVGSTPKHDIAIINVGATASLDAWAEVLPFCLAKGALRDYSRALARDLDPKGIHVAHLVIDGMLDNPRTRKLNRSMKTDRFINCKSVAQTIIQVALQDKSCWTFEWDVRPYNENW
jgi:NAD(P)-dependent dehydrogenase (short-subunit alcohol dehydrogenase family)